VQQLTFGDVPTAVAMLDAGDLLIATDNGDMLGIERKTASDFLNTLRDDRLFPQLIRLREAVQWPYLALCGNVAPAMGGKCFANGMETGWNWASVSGALLTVQEIGVHVLQVASDHEFEAAIMRLGNRDRTAVRVARPRQAEFLSEAETTLTGLPGIGPEKAAALLEACGNAGWAIDYLTNDDWEGLANGVGEGIKRRVRKALGLPDWAALAVIVKETGNPPEGTKVCQRTQ
jgi:ERCC4-type nuclease